MIHRRSFFAMMLGAAALPVAQALPAVAAPSPARDLDWASIAKLQGVPERWTMPEMQDAARWNAAAKRIARSFKDMD